MTAQDFLPEGYSIPKSKGGYMKLQAGKNKLRVLSSPLTGYEDWNDRTPVRTKEKRKAIGPSREPKHFRAMKVLDHADGEVKILSITQKGIMQAIEDYLNTEEFGSPLLYDLEITKTGQNMETKYAVVALPPKPLTKDVQSKCDSVKVNLEALFDGWDPFDTSDEDVDADRPF